MADTPDVNFGSTRQPLTDAGTYLRLASDARLISGAEAGTAGATIWRYRPVLLYVRDYSLRPGDGIPALCRLRLSPGRFDVAPAECLLEGLEMLQVEFGVDADGDRRADRYVSVLAEDDAPVLARISVLMRSSSHAGSTLQPRTYQLGPRSYTAPDRRQRLLLSTTVLLRNAGALRG